MKYVLAILMVILSFMGCKQVSKSTSKSFSKVIIEPIIEDSLLNIRALEVGEYILKAVSSVGDVYTYDMDTNQIRVERISEDTLNFRSSALVNDSFLALSIEIGRAHV